MFREQQFRNGLLRLNFAQGPANGPPLLLLHGVTRRWQSFVPILPALATRWQINALDFRGHGRSDRAGDGYLVVDYVDDAVAFLESQVTEPAIIYGHSLGSMVAAAVASRAPKHVRGVILEDPPFTTMGNRIRETALHGYFSALVPFCGSNRSVAAIARDLAEIRMASPGAPPVRVGDVRDAASLRFTARSLKDLDPQTLTSIAECRWLDGYSYRDLLPGVRCPALLLQADVAAGGMLVDAEAAEVERLIPDCSRVRLTGAGHLIHWLQTESLLRLVLSFLESLETCGDLSR